MEKYHIINMLDYLDESSIYVDNREDLISIIKKFDMYLEQLRELEGFSDEYWKYRNIYNIIKEFCYEF